MRGSGFSALLLAAGQSRRSGPVPKLLAVRDGRTMLAHSLSALLASQLEQVVLVLPPQPEALLAAIADGAAHPKLKRVINPQAGEGMASSIRAGLSGITAKAVLICLADMPDITSVQIDLLLNHHHPGMVVVPAWEGIPGNPVLFDQEFFPLLTMLRGDQGARQIFPMLEGTLKMVDARSNTVLKDYDTQDAVRGWATGVNS